MVAQKNTQAIMKFYVARDFNGCKTKMEKFRLMQLLVEKWQQERFCTLVELL
jgi:hypothetical protein